MSCMPPKESLLFCFSRISFPLPPPWSEHAGCPCASAPPLRCFRSGYCCLPRGFPSREHHSGAAALHPHHPSGKLVLGGKCEPAGAEVGFNT